MSEIIPKIINELNNKNFLKALKISEEYSEKDNLHILNNLKGIIFIKLQNPKKAIECFEKSLKGSLV